jgi:nitrite reductase/ring-hydroxylating ferredoxin subunit
MAAGASPRYTRRTVVGVTKIKKRRPASTKRRATTPRTSASLQSSEFAQLFDAIESIPGLEAVNEAIAGALTPVTKQTGLMDVLHGRWLGHALHPVLSDAPLGLWGSVPLLDLIGDERGATALTAAGCVAAVATAVTGAADWSVTVGRDRRLALVHGLANTGVLMLQLGALAARLGGRRRTGQLLSVAGLGGSMGAAFLGGELVFGRALMVDHTATLAGPDKWTDAVADEDVAEGSKQAVDVDGRKVFITRVDGTVHAMENTCSHAGGPLDEGSIEDGCVVCPWHGSRFRLDDGAVVGGPATFPQLQLQTRVVKGRIEVRGREG